MGGGASLSLAPMFAHDESRRGKRGDTGDSVQRSLGHFRAELGAIGADSVDDGGLHRHQVPSWFKAVQGGDEHL